MLAVLIVEFEWWARPELNRRKRTRQLEAGCSLLVQFGLENRMVGSAGIEPAIFAM